MHSTPVRRHRLHPAGRRAASQRSRGRRADHRARHVKRGRTEVICGQGPAPARKATIAHYRERRPGDGARHRAACRLRSRHVSNPGCCYCATTAPCGCATCWSRRSPMPRDGYPLVERADRRRSRPSRSCSGTHWPTSAAVYLPNGEVPKPGTLFTNNQLAAKPIQPHPARKPKARAAIAYSPDRARAQSMVARLRRRGDRQILPHPGRSWTCQRLAASRRAVGRRHGEAGSRRLRRR